MRQFISSTNRIMMRLVIRMKSWLMPIVLAFSLWIPMPAGAQTRLHVDTTVTAAFPTGQNPGETWENGFKYLKDALYRADEIHDEIDPDTVIELWIAAGTYRPDEDSANPTGDGEVDKSFSMHNNIRLYGGFLGLNYPGGGETAKN
jgi:hypothetical protein